MVTYIVLILAMALGIVDLIVLISSIGTIEKLGNVATILNKLRQKDKEENQIKINTLVEKILKILNIADGLDQRITDLKELEQKRYDCIVEKFRVRTKRIQKLELLFSRMLLSESVRINGGKIEVTEPGKKVNIKSIKIKKNKNK
jgi:hypothetical protein